MQEVQNTEARNTEARNTEARNTEARNTEVQNTKIVKDAYDAFGRGDVQTLLGYFDDAILWKPVHGAAGHVPTAGERRGTAAVGEFFKIVKEQVTFLRFEPKDFVAEGDKVVAIGHYAAQVPTGRGFDSDFVMVFTLRDGKVVQFQEFSDSAAINAAYDNAA
jgi:ketosteroid isomerase-like protein